MPNFVRKRKNDVMATNSNHQIVRGIDALAAEGLLREVDGAVQGSGNELIELVASELEALLVQAAVDRDGCTGDV